MTDLPVEESDSPSRVVHFNNEAKHVRMVREKILTEEAIVFDSLAFHTVIEPFSDQVCWNWCKDVIEDGESYWGRSKEFKDKKKDELRALGRPCVPHLHTLTGTQRVNHGDYILRHPLKGFYVVDHDTFHEVYEEVG